MSTGFQGIPENYVVAEHLASNIGYLWKKTATPTPGTDGNYGTAVEYTPPSNARSIIPLQGVVTWGGTFATGETVTVRVTVTYNDGATANITKSATATGSTSITLSDLMSLWTDGKYITKVSVDSSSDQASTSVTTSVDLIGITI